LCTFDNGKGYTAFLVPNLKTFVMSKNTSNAITAQTLADFQQLTGLAGATKVQITIRAGRVTANCRLRGRCWGSRGSTQAEALQGLLQRIGQG
jgi:hypothetical protein